MSRWRELWRQSARRVTEELARVREAAGAFASDFVNTFESPAMSTSVLSDQTSNDLAHRRRNHDRARHIGSERSDVLVDSPLLAPATSTESNGSSETLDEMLETSSATENMSSPFLDNGTSYVSRILYNHSAQTSRVSGEPENEGTESEDPNAIPNDSQYPSNRDGNSIVTTTTTSAQGRAQHTIQDAPFRHGQHLASLPAMNPGENEQPARRQTTTRRPEYREFLAHLARVLADSVSNQRAHGDDELISHFTTFSVPEGRLVGGESDCPICLDVLGGQLMMLPCWCVGHAECMTTALRIDVRCPLHRIDVRTLIRPRSAGISGLSVSPSISRATSDSSLQTAGDDTSFGRDEQTRMNNGPGASSQTMSSDSRADTPTMTRSTTTSPTPVQSVRRRQGERTVTVTSSRQTDFSLDQVLDDLSIQTERLIRDLTHVVVDLASMLSDAQGTELTGEAVDGVRSDVEYDTEEGDEERDETAARVREPVVLVHGRGEGFADVRAEGSETRAEYVEHDVETVGSPIADRDDDSVVDNFVVDTVAEAEPARLRYEYAGLFEIEWERPEQPDTSGN